MLSKKIRKIICGVITSIILCSSTTVLATGLEEVSTSITGTYDIVVEGFDWGPGVTKAIITIDREVSNVTKEMFKVEEVKQSMFDTDKLDITNRTITNAYLCDENGNELEGSSNKIALELSVHPDFGNPFLFSLQTFTNSWAEPYELNITLADGEELVVGEEVFKELNINKEFINRMTPTVDAFKEATYENEGDISMSYAYYEPQEDNKKNPLIIWLHGAGEGGYDTQIITLGNKVGALIEDNIQSEFGGAYVLAPQSPTMWMDQGGKQYTQDGSSIYSKSLMNLIKHYVNTNDDIDTNRIYVGGCSNGGFMTMSLILDNPEYFAAAYPICEAYNDSWISEEELEGIKGLPIWFTYAMNDSTVDPETTSISTISRLIDYGAKDIKVSKFDNVVDTSGLYKDSEGNPYEYNGHWSWLYAFNDECKDDEESLWSWLAKQEKEIKVDEPVEKPSDEPEEEENDKLEEEKPSIPVAPEEDRGDVIVDETNKEDNITDKDDSTETGKGELPNTGSPISSVTVAIMGSLSTAAGFKMIRRKKK